MDEEAVLLIPAGTLKGAAEVDVRSQKSPERSSTASFWVGPPPRIRTFRGFLGLPGF
ncbi:hypothetical protein Daudx_1858 [Candidatus Desulforudis audaxviator]|nr:hypothetical protein Daudx_1858 [Candidatus Desulforudis audaxviator]